MARARFRRTTRQINGKTRKFIWAKDGATAQLAPAATSHRDGLSLFEGLLGSELLGATVAINHLDYMFLDDGTLMGVDQATLGARIFTQSTLPQLTSAHGPVSDPNADWMVYQPVMMCSEPNHVDVHTRVELSSQRTLKELGDSMLISVENATAGQLTFRYAVTIGVLLP